MDVGLRIKLFRVAAGLKQQEVAEALGVTTNYISMLERGKREPTLKFLKGFAKFLKVPVSVLVWDLAEDRETRESSELHAKLGALMAEFAAKVGVKKPRSA